MFFDHIAIVPLTKHPQIKRMIREVNFMGCVLDYVPFEQEGAIEFALHRQRSIDAMKILQRSSEIFARNQKLNQYFEVALDETSLHGQLIEATQFWGNDDAETKWKNGVGFGPLVDGYKTAFFNPPLGMGLSLSERIELFDQLNARLWNDDLSDCSIYNWSTNWSNYFDAGHEYWGAFWWTVYSPQTRLLTAIGASATDGICDKISSSCAKSKQRGCGSGGFLPMFRCCFRWRSSAGRNSIKFSATMCASNNESS